jgi:sugar (pentulose or hexulose) kinase
LAAYGAGHFVTIDEGIEAMVHEGRTIDPIAANVSRYEEIYAQYLALYPALNGVLR